MIDPGATLSFVTPLEARKFDVLPNVLIEPFSVCTLIADPMVAKMVNKECPVMLPSRVTLVDLVKLDMFDFYIFLGMFWLYACFASIDFS